MKAILVFAVIAACCGAVKLCTTADDADCQMGWATQCNSGAGVKGGENATAAMTFTVKTRAQLVAALDSKLTGPRIVYVAATLRGDDLGNGTYATADYYRKYPTANKFYFDLYLLSFNTTAMTALQKSNATLYALALNQTAELQVFYTNQKSQIEVVIPSHTSIIGVGSTGVIQGFYLRTKAATDIIVRNMYIEAPRDNATQWSSDDGFNAQYDGITVENSTCLWFDHDTFTDGRYPDSSAGTFMGEEIQYHDGLLDIKTASDYITVSHCIFANHSKTNLFGSSDSAKTDAGHLRVTVYKNLFYHTIQRTPRVRYGKVHVLSNYYIAASDTSYFIGLGYNCSIISETNAFEASDVSTVVDSLNGVTFTDKGSWLNCNASSSAIMTQAAKEVGSGFTSVISWTPPYTYWNSSNCSTLKSYILKNSGYGIIDAGSSASSDAPAAAASSSSDAPTPAGTSSSSSPTTSVVSSVSSATTVASASSTKSTSVVVSSSATTSSTKDTGSTTSATSGVSRSFSIAASVIILACLL